MPQPSYHTTMELKIASLFYVTETDKCQNRKSEIRNTLIIVCCQHIGKAYPTQVQLVASTTELHGDWLVLLPGVLQGRKETGSRQGREPSPSPGGLFSGRCSDSVHLKIIINGEEARKSTHVCISGGDSVVLPTSTFSIHAYKRTDNRSIVLSRSQKCAKNQLGKVRGLSIYSLSRHLLFLLGHCYLCPPLSSRGRRKQKGVWTITRRQQAVAYGAGVVPVCTSGLDMAHA